MTTILRLESSASGSASVTSGLNELLLERLTAIHPDSTIVERDLTALPVLTADSFAANGTPVAERSADQSELASLADALIAELSAADVIVLGAPIYNFGLPSSVKAWMDLVARAGTTFTYTETGPKGLLEGKTAYVVTASGGVSIGDAADFATPHITLFLNFLGISDVSIIDAAGLMMDPEKVQKAQAQIRELISA
ncbi:MAG: FMN-dependent NADH-azoreductase [Verrucomicrobiales bacterium]|jgi:FMN-dependent NADH-azoreductase